MANDTAKANASKQIEHPEATTVIDLRQGANPLEIISVSGDVDIATAPRLHEKLMAAFDHDPSEVLVDLSDVTFIDSSGLSVLVSARQRAHAIGAVMKLILPRGHARFPFEVTGLVSVFDYTEAAGTTRSYRVRAKA